MPSSFGVAQRHVHRVQDSMLTAVLAALAASDRTVWRPEYGCVATLQNSACSDRLHIQVIYTRRAVSHIHRRVSRLCIEMYLRA